MPEPTTLTLDNVRRVRTGTSLGFTLYAQFGPEPTKQDPYLGAFNNPMLASYAVRAINERYVESDLPWIAVGRLIYPEPGAAGLDDFIAVMVSPAVANWVAGVVCSQPPAKGRHG